MKFLMWKQVDNHSMSISQFMAFSRDELIEIAKALGTKRGRSKRETADNLVKGISRDGGPQRVTFPVRIEIPIDKKW